METAGQLAAAAVSSAGVVRSSQPVVAGLMKPLFSSAAGGSGALYSGHPERGADYGDVGQSRTAFVGGALGITGGPFQDCCWRQPARAPGNLHAHR